LHPPNHAGYWLRPSDERALPCLGDACRARVQLRAENSACVPRFPPKLSAIPTGNSAPHLSGDERPRAHFTPSQCRANSHLPGCAFLRGNASCIRADCESHTARAFPSCAGSPSDLLLRHVWADGVVLALLPHLDPRARLRGYGDGGLTSNTSLLSVAFTGLGGPLGR